MAVENYSTQQVIDAIRAARGVKADAARRLRCDRHTVDNYCARYPTVQRAYEQERQALVDLAESVLLTALDDGDVSAAKYVLSTLGKGRGWSDQGVIDAIISRLEALEHGRNR